MWRRERNDAEDLRRVYRENVEPVYAYFAYSVPRDTAEDLTSETFERVIRSWRRYDSSRGLERTWVFAIARNLLTDHFRRQRHRGAVSTDEHPELLEQIWQEDPFERILSAKELQTLLAPLRQRDREVVALRYGADLTAPEIAELLGLTPSNVHQILSRSLKRLRRQLTTRRVTGSA